MRKAIMAAAAAAAMLATGDAVAAPLRLGFTGTTLGKDSLYGSSSAAVTIVYDSAASPQGGVFGTQYALDSFRIDFLDASGATIATEAPSAGSSPVVEIFDGLSSDNIFFTGLETASSRGVFSFSVFSLDNNFTDEALANLTVNFLDTGTGPADSSIPRFRIDAGQDEALFVYDRGSASLTIIPLPAGLPLLLSGLAGLALLRRRG